MSGPTYSDLNFARLQETQHRLFVLLLQARGLQGALSAWVTIPEVRDSLVEFKDAQTAAEEVVAILEELKFDLDVVIEQLGASLNENV